MIEILDSATGPAFTASDVLLDLVEVAAGHALGSLGPPMLFVLDGQERAVTRFLGGEVQQARRALAELDHAGAWVVVADGAIDGQHALIIQAGEERSDATLVFHQRYRPGTGGALPQGPIRFRTEEPPLRPNTRNYGAFEGYGSFILLPRGSEASLSAAVQPVREALDDVDGGATITRERARLVGDCAEGEWRVTVGLSAGPRIERSAPRLLELAAAAGDLRPRTGDFLPGHARFTVDTSPDEDMDFFNDWLFVTDALESAFGGQQIDRALLR